MPKALVQIICWRLFFFSLNAFAFDLPELEKIIADKSTVSIQSLIPKLPKELKENFSFVYESRSPFAASISPQYPRVVLFTPDARLILTFTGDPKQPGYDILEVMDFDDHSARFNFKAYVLPNAAPHAQDMTAAAKDCTHCHGLDSRPIYDSYPLWPGFYGSILDSFPPLRRKEYKNYRKFLAKNAKTGVYQNLIYRTDTPVPPYLDPKLFDAKKTEGEISHFKYMPNTRLGMALTELNRHRIYRKLSSSQNFLRQERTLLAGLLDCIPMRIPPIRFKITEQKIREENKLRLKRLGSSTGNDMEELKFVRELTELDWIAKRSGLDHSDWSLAMEANSYSFFDGILSGIWNKKSFYIQEFLALEMFRHQASLDPRLNQFFSSDLTYQENGYPFGRRLDITKARGACAELTKRPVISNP